MTRSGSRFDGIAVLCAALCATALCGCGQRQELIRLSRDNRVLRDANALLERTLVDRDERLSEMGRQVETLKGFGPNRPADLFAPVELEMASLSGGADYDDEPGDDGITLHIRPRDRDGDVVKAPGRIRVQLLDASTFGSPRVIGTYVFESPVDLRETWHSRFGTNHYTLKCPFPSGAVLPESHRLLADIEFTDYLTGATLTLVEHVTFTPAP